MGLPDLSWYGFTGGGATLTLKNKELCFNSLQNDIHLVPMLLRGNAYFHHALQTSSNPACPT